MNPSPKPFLLIHIQSLSMPDSTIYMHQTDVSVEGFDSREELKEAAETIMAGEEPGTYHLRLYGIDDDGDWSDIGFVDEEGDLVFPND